MSFEQGSQFETDKGTSQPYKLPAENANKDRVQMKGASNIHQVQIGDKRLVGDYQSLTKMQQSGHKQRNTDKLKSNDDFTMVRAKIAEQTKELRSSHFALGVDKTVA